MQEGVNMGAELKTVHLLEVRSQMDLREGFSLDQVDVARTEERGGEEGGVFQDQVGCDRGETVIEEIENPFTKNKGSVATFIFGWEVLGVDVFFDRSFHEMGKQVTENPG